MKSVSEYIMEKYDISISPGKKGDCPFCDHKKFSIKKDDSIIRIGAIMGLGIAYAGSQKDEVKLTMTIK